MFDFTQKISRKECIIDPIRTKATPTTSIQFWFPGRIFDNTVYCAAIIRTVGKHNMTDTVLPDMVAQAYMCKGLRHTYAKQCKVTNKVSYQFWGNVKSFN